MVPTAEDSTPRPVNILVVDDEPANLLALEAVLDDLGQNLVRADSGEEALRQVLDDEFAVILLDVKMRGMDGFETARLIRGRERSRHTPIIFLTAYDENRLPPTEAYAVGAVDYLVKPVVPAILRSKVRVFVELFQKAEQVKQQAAQLQEMERSAFEHQLAEEKQRWEVERLRQETAQERALAAASTQKADQLAALNRELQNEMAERRRVEEERQQLQAQVQHAQKLESLGVLAGGIAHDFNNLLTGMLGNASLAQQEVPAGSAAAALLGQIETAAVRAAELTQQMLAYSGKGRFVVQPVDLGQVVREMAGLLQTVISKKADLRFDFTPDLPAVQADPSQLRQVVMNLMTNASESLGDQSGAISVRTGMIEADRAYLASAHVREDLPEGRYVYLDVTDSGCGMDAATREKIFDPFFTTKFTGRGLGLAAVLGIVRGHHGTIRVSSRPGRGSTFRVLFPAALKVEATPALDAPPPDSWSGRGTVLVVDDEDTVRALSRRALESWGLRVFVAADGQEGVELFRQVGEAVDAVLLDWTMPKMGGAEVYAELQRLRPGLPVIVMSGFTEQAVVGLTAAEGFAGFIQKPFRLADLRAALRRALEKRAAAPAASEAASEANGVKCEPVSPPRDHPSRRGPTLPQDQLARLV